MSILPKLMTGSGGIGLDTFVKLAEIMSAFVPSANQSSCLNVRWKKKTICEAPCVRLCPTKAISVSDSVSIDSSKCISCNICATSCPHGVFGPNIPSDFSLYESILAAKKKGNSAIRFACDRCNGRYGKSKKRVAKGVETIVLPCLGSLSETLPIHAMRLGCKTIVDACPEECGFSEGRKCYELAMSRFEGVRDSFDVRPYDTPRAGGNVETTGLERRRFLLSAGENIMKAIFDLKEARNAGPSQSLNGQAVPTRRKELLVLTQGLEPKATNTRPFDYPMLEIHIDEDPCNLCDVCSKMCPTGALKILEKADSALIAFSLGRCTGCRLCIEVCPKSCVSSTGANLGVVNLGERILVEKKITRCKSCDFRFVRIASSEGEESCPLCEKKRNMVVA